MSTSIEKTKKALTGILAATTSVVIANVVTTLPIFGLPGFNFVLSWTVNWVVNQIRPYLEIWLVDTVVDFEVNAEIESYEKAKEELKKVLNESVKNQKEIEKASQEFDRRLSDLIRIRK